MGPPKARIAVLKPIMKEIKAGHPIYKLKSQSPVEDLSGFLGQTTTFTLDTPLRVKPNNIVALTVPTWAPAFAINQSADTKWQASRKRGKCNATADILAGTPQEAVEYAAHLRLHLQDRPPALLGDRGRGAESGAA